MDERMKESVSALMDDEVNELELQRVLSHTDQQELTAAWSRYHRIRDLLNHDKTEFLDINVRQAVSTGIEQDDSAISDIKENVNVSDAPINTTSPLRFSGFLTIAASAIFAFVFVFQNTLQIEPHESPTYVGKVSLDGNDTLLSSKSGNNSVPRQPKILAGLSAENAERLNSYLLRHSEYSALGSQTNVMPLVRVASVNSVGI